MRELPSTAHRHGVFPRVGGASVDVDAVSAGQKIVLIAVVFWLILLATIVLAASRGSWSADVLRYFGGLIAAVIATFGVIKVTGGLGWSTTACVLTVALMFLPPISVLVLLIVNARATRALRDAGYSVDLFGAAR